jgi:L-ascorbate metabolism protein UlaG (beta-lactamase superfamily)
LSIFSKDVARERVLLALEIFTKFCYSNGTMVITYFGNGSFRLQSGDTVMLVDPENNRLKADVTIHTLTSANPTDVLDGSDAGMKISFSGEYEMKGIETEGFSIKEESTEKFLKTAYKVMFEDMKFVFLGHLSGPLDASLMEEFSEPDVLILPAGGGHFLEPDVAAKIAKQLEARIVMPSFVKNADLFLKALGRKADPVEKFVFKQKDIITDKGRPIVLKPA